jgi:HEAT repeat protein
MTVRSVGEKQKVRSLEEEKTKKQLLRLVEQFNSQDVNTRLNAIDAWAQAASTNPGNALILDQLPEVVRHLKDTNVQVLGAALDAWKASAKANPGDRNVLSYLPAIVERLNDPDELVRYAATSALEAAIKANPGHPLVEKAKAEHEQNR